MVDMLRRVVTPVQVQIQLVLASQPSQIELQIDDLFLREATWNISSISGKLMIEDMLNAGFPSDIALAFLACWGCDFRLHQR